LKRGARDPLPCGLSVEDGEKQAIRERRRPFFHVEVDFPGFRTIYLEQAVEWLPPLRSLTFE
jgi:hypothetical protein